jgi:FixJ family two-component response regulator
MIPPPYQFCESFYDQAMHREGLRVASGYLISIIEDDDSLRRALVGLICSLGHDAHGFESAEEFAACDAMRSSACIITDIQLPGMSGIELKQMLAEHRCPVPVIMITARHEAGLEERAIAAGAVCCLRKPFETGALADCVEQILRA